jgi:DNA-binding NarL/FixJ family response regulator
VKVLIIEDDQNKLEQLATFVASEFPAESVGRALSYRNGLAALLSEKWDLVLLDMQLPTFDKSPRESGGRQRAFAGEQILRKMAHNKITAPAIVVTQFEKFGDLGSAISLRELMARLQSAGYPNYRGTVYYHAKISDWKSELRQLIERVTK